MELIKKSYKGVLLCLLIAIPSYLAAEYIPNANIIGGPVFAILIGMIITLIAGEKIKDSDTFKPGITYTSKKILQYAVILLGFGLNLTTLLQVGGTSLPIILATITTSLVISFVIFKLLKIDSKISVLVGVGSSICGGSAIAATAPVIDADDEEIAQSISVIFLFNVIAALIFPTLGSLMGMSADGFSLFAGTAVNDTSSVTAAASSYDGILGTGSKVLDGAVIVKLTRTLAIIPITLVLAFYRLFKEKKNTTGGAKMNFSFKKIFPWFILFFLGASIITTIVSALGNIDNTAVVTVCSFLQNNVFTFLKWLSKFFIIMAMAAIGLNTNIIKLIKTGGKPIFMGFCCWVGITGVSLMMQHFLGLL